MKNMKKFLVCSCYGMLILVTCILVCVGIVSLSESATILLVLLAALSTLATIGLAIMEND